MSRRIKTETLIIGAGPAGLACAMELSRKQKDFIVVEKSDRSGGLSKTYAFPEEGELVFYTDNGPHRFFSKNQYLYDFIGNLVGEDWIKVRRQTRQYIDGVFYDYPVNAVQALKNIGIFGALRMSLDYLYAKIKYGFLKVPIKNFEDYAYAKFGKSLADFNIVNYTEKIWGIPASTIHPDWAMQRIKGLDLVSLVVNAIKKIFNISGNGPKSLIDEFYYPSKGTGLIYETIVSKIKEQGYEVYMNTEPVSITFKTSTETEVVLKTNSGEEFIVECAYLVESVPIVDFVHMLQPPVSPQVHSALSQLRYRDQVYLFITLNKEKLTDDQWIYFPSQNTPVARVSEMRNFSHTLSPEGKTSLFVEFFCFENDTVWNMSKEELLDEVLRVMSGVFFERTDVRHVYKFEQKKVYPVYDLSYREYLDVVKQYLDQYNNLFYIGRPGRFRYNNQDHSLEMGMLAAQSIIDGVHYDIELVGAEKEHYEAGSVPQSRKP